MKKNCSCQKSFKSNFTIYSNILSILEPLSLVLLIVSTKYLGSTPGSQTVFSNFSKPFKPIYVSCEFIWTFYLYMEFVFIVVLYDCRTIRESIKYRAQPSSSFHIGTGSCWISNMSALRKVVGVSGRSWLHIYTIYIYQTTASNMLPQRPFPQ